MAQKVTDTQSVTAAGAYAPATMTRFPLGGGTFSVKLDTGAAVMQLLAWNVGMSSTPEIIASFSLPVDLPGDPKDGDMHDSVPVDTVWDNWKWNVVSISPGSTAVLSAVGLDL